MEKELSNIQFYMKNCTGIVEEFDIQQEYETYKLYDNDGELDYEEWLEEVFYKNNKNEIDEQIIEYNNL